MGRRSSGGSTAVDQGLGLGVYGMYALSPFLAGLPALAGVLIAYARRESAGELPREHYDFQIRSFWVSITCLIAAGVWGASAFWADQVAGEAEMAAFGALAVGALGAATLWPVGAAIFGMVRLLSGKAIDHDDALEPLPAPPRVRRIPVH